MSNIYVEHRQVADQRIGTFARDVAHHLFLRQLDGRVIVLTIEPFVFMGMLRKFWLALMRTVQVERSRTLRSERILELTHQIERMQHLKFVAKTPDEAPLAQIFFMSPKQLDTKPPKCHTIYVTCGIESELRIRLEGCLERGGALVEYVKE
jgi:hypothetical protein